MSLAALPALQQPALREALAAYLIAIADDELILGHRHSEWTGFAPDIESDVALSSIAQEELGHARLFYERACELVGGVPDGLAFGRPPERFRNAVLAERPNGDWGFSIVRLFLYDRADAVRLGALAAGTIRELADLAATLRREEKYHLLYGEQWLRRLAGASADSRRHVQDALNQVWPEAVAIFEPAPAEYALVEAGVLAASAAVQRGSWQNEMKPTLEALELEISAGSGRSTSGAAPNGVGGRGGHHTEDLRLLLEEMTSVWRMEPGGRW